MFNWGIIGTGFVARKFVLGLRAADDAHAVTVASHTAASADKFAADFGLTSHGDNIAALLAAPIDAVYIATPPTAHRKAALAAIAAGKPVLIEKPLAASLADARAIVGAAHAAGVFAMEGVWTRFLPLFAAARARLPELGEIRSLEASFGLANTPDPADNQFSAALGGGALLHRGLYPLALALGLLGPAKLEASAATIGASGADEDCTLLLRHASGALSTLRASLRAPLANDLRIEGTHGFLHLETPVYRPFAARLTTISPAKRTSNTSPRFEFLRESTLAQSVQQRLTSLKRPAGQRFTRRFVGNGYHYEADAVMRAVRAGHTESPEMPLADSLAIAEMIEAARTAWGTARD